MNSLDRWLLDRLRTRRDSYKDAGAAGALQQALDDVRTYLAEREAQEPIAPDFDTALGRAIENGTWPR